MAKSSNDVCLNGNMCESERNEDTEVDMDYVTKYLSQS